MKQRRLAHTVAFRFWDPFKYRGVRYNERYYNERMLKRTVFVNKIRMLQNRAGILFIMESSIIIFTMERLFMLFMCVRLYMLFY